MNLNHLIVEDIKKWIEENVETPLKIDCVSKKSGYSKWHIQRVFKCCAGITLGQYVRERRIAHATHDLIKTNDSIKTISEKYGFPDQHAFCRIFTRFHSVSPMKFRNNNRLQ